MLLLAVATNSYPLPSFTLELENSKISFMKDVSENGFSVIENYFTDSYCENLKSSIDQLLINFPQKVITRSDERIYGAEKNSVS